MSKIKGVTYNNLNSIHCTIEDLPNAINAILSAYADDVANITDKSVKKVTKETVKVVKKTGDYKNRRPKYRKSIRSRVEPGLNGAKGVVYAGGHEYSLTHLLENGHRLWNSPRRTSAFPHWVKGEDYAQQALPKLLIQELKG